MFSSDNEDKNPTKRYILKSNKSQVPIKPENN